MKTQKASEAVAVESFVTLLRRHRLAKGLTQTALAKKLGVAPSSVSQWESGIFVPHARMIPLLARILEIDALTLTNVIDQPPAPRGNAA